MPRRKPDPTRAEDECDLLALQLAAQGVSLYAACKQAGAAYSRIAHILDMMKREDDTPATRKSPARGNYSRAY